MPTVYIPNRSGHDFSQAEKFGELVFLSEGDVPPFQVNRIYRDFAAVLRNSNPDDFIMITSLSVMSSIASAIMARKHGRVNWLLYHAKTQGYKARTVMVDELIEGK